MARILVIDNYDSFVFNIVQYLAQLGAEVIVKRNDEVDVQYAADFDGVLLSPGPGAPREAGISMAMVEYCRENKIPLFGVCLGHQAIAESFGATVSRAPELLHGKTSEIFHQGESVMSSLPQGFQATRYHSLAVEKNTVPEELIITCQTESGVVMGLKHSEYLIEGVQFHPESVLTEGGHRMLAEWLTQCGDENAIKKSEGLSPLMRRD
ncbi:MAG: aminodeoxychorismate/anthranilate synthase component II [Candidatus Nanopelagicales bacterium]